MNKRIRRPDLIHERNAFQGIADNWNASRRKFGYRIPARERANIMPSIDEFLNHPAADVSGAPGDEDFSP
jgi:hypothetical protein